MHYAIQLITNSTNSSESFVITSISGLAVVVTSSYTMAQRPGQQGRLLVVPDLQYKCLVLGADVLLRGLACYQ